MATKNVTICKIGGTTITGITRFTCSLRRGVNAIHYDDEDYAQCAGTDGWVVEGTVEGVDMDRLLAKENVYSATGVEVTVAAADAGGTARTFAIENTQTHSVQIGSGEPGGNASASLSFTAASSNGGTSPLTIT